jgi:2-keto-4-pentenoate hydratase/2-oxohepta-3-ene-1,7-dioic acid hydratase in catechol pathway|tara:strand:- start:1482 stop:2090 length:609 start_codon:yes stop_codon:yes gene_type:complete
LKIICIGRNFTDHIEELDNQKPKNPVVFMKPDTSLIQKNQPFFTPAFSDDIHHEVELVIKINRIGKYIDQKFAHKYYENITVGLDFTARDLQNDLKVKGLPWEKSKSFDGSALIGKWLNKNEFNLNNLNFHLNINNTLIQKGNTSLMLWKIDEIISYVSQFFTLKIGDLIFTGTPAGVSRLNKEDVLEGFVEEIKCFQIKIK